MNRSKIPALLSAIFIVLLLSSLPCRAEIDTVEQALDYLKTYRFGDSRQPLNLIEHEVNRCLPGSSDQQQLADKLADLLTDPNTTYDCTDFLCRQLARIGTEKQVPILAELLRNPQTAHIARYGLQAIPGPAADQALIDALSQTSGLQKTAIINSLASRRSRTAVQAITAALTDTNENVARAAAYALGKIGTENAALALQAALPECQDDLYPALADACLRCADCLLAENKTQSATTIYRQMYQRDQSPLIRAAALNGMAAAAQPGQAVSLVVEALSDPALPVRKMAARLAARIPGRDATNSLAQKIPQLTGPAQVPLLIALGCRGDKAALPAIRTACNSPDADVRTAALKAMGRLADAAGVPFLAQRAAQAAGDEQQAARRSLNILAAPNVNAEMIKHLAVAEPAVKIELIDSLAERGASEAADALLRNTTDPDKRVRLACLKALRRLAAGKHIAPLLDRLAEAQNPERGETEKTLAAVLHRCDPASHSDIILTRLRTAENSDAQTSLLRILALTETETALNRLRQSLNNTNPDICLTALRALSHWPNAEPINDLLQIARNSDNVKHRVLALRGCVRMIDLTNQSAEYKVELYRQAMNLAAQNSEKKRILSALAANKSLEALKMAADYLDNADLQQEAQLAAVRIAANTAAAYPQQSGQILQDIVSTTSIESIREQARQTISMISRFDDYITAWQVAGPYTHKDADDKKLFDIPFAPETADANNVQWQLMPPGDPAQPWLIRLDALFGGSNRVAYLKTIVRSQSHQQLMLELGSDDGVKAWLNGQLVHANNVNRGCTPGEDKVKVALKKGTNTLLLKITQGGGGWNACARFRTLDDKTPRGLHCTVSQ